MGFSRFGFRPASIIPRTLEEAQWLEDQEKLRKAQEAGEWLPEGWKWDTWPVEGLGHVEGALRADEKAFVFIAGDAQFGTEVPMRVVGAAPKIVIDMVWNRWWRRKNQRG